MKSERQEKQTEKKKENGVLTLDSLSVEYETDRGPVKALRDVNLTLHEGEMIGIAGESGSGKSTLALAILQYLSDNGTISSGDIRLDGESLVDMSAKELYSIRGNKLAHVAQDPQQSLNPSLTVGEQIKETISIHQGKNEFVDEFGTTSTDRAHAMLEIVGISDPVHVFKQYPHELSGGMQQRILIAMALSCSPNILILDEPTTGLDVTTQANILNLINDLRERYDTTILLISHNLGVISEVADRVAILYAGEIMEKAPVSTTFESPANPYTQGLLATMPEIETKKHLKSIPGQIPDLTNVPDGCIFAERCELAKPECRYGSIDIESVDQDHQTRCQRWETAVENPIEADEVTEEPRNKGEKLLEVSGLKKYYDVPGVLDSLLNPDPPVKAVNGVDLTLYERTSLALVGESGCGKSTLGRTILNLTEATSGDIMFRGNSLDEMTDEEYKQFRSECRIIFQNPESSLNPRKSVFDLISRPLSLFTDYDEEEQQERVAELLTEVGLSDGHASRHPHELSGGEQQRVAIARAFAAEPSLVVLDEPVSSLDVSVQADILDLLDRLRDEYTASYLFITHDLSVVRHLCDDVAVMYLGKIVEIGSVKEIFEDPFHPYTEALLNSIPSVEPEPDNTELATLKGEVPSPRNPPTGCEFHGRCPDAREACAMEDPELIPTASHTERKTACFKTQEDHEYWDSDPLPDSESDSE